MAGDIAVVVIGGGYAGVLAANRLTQRDDVAVTLVNPRPSFVERLRLHQLVAGSDDAIVDYGEVLAQRVKLLVDTATLIDPAQRRVVLASGGAVDYDYLIYAVGSESTHSGVPGANKFAHPLATLEEARRLSRVLAASPATARVTVVGGGPAGIETAAELAALQRPVTLVCGGVLGPYMHPKARRSLAKRLAKLGVAVIQGAGTKVTAVTRDTVHLASGRALPSEVTVWTAGFAVPDLAWRSGFCTDSLGRLLTDETLTSVDDMRVVAAGDCAAPSDLPLRMSAQAAQPLGSHAADTVLARVAGRRPAPIEIAVMSQCISLGRRSGVFQFASPKDVATRYYLGGRLVAMIKEASCKWVVRKLREEAHKPGSYTWPFKNKGRRKQVEAKRGVPVVMRRHPDNAGARAQPHLEPNVGRPQSRRA